MATSSILTAGFIEKLFDYLLSFHDNHHHNSDDFKQAATVGLSHAAILRHIVASACNRNAIALPWYTAPANVSPFGSASLANADGPSKKKQVVRVIFGGGTSERQVSLMSGTNVWLKLRGQSDDLTVEPFLLVPHTEQVLHHCHTTVTLPATQVLHNCHTVEPSLPVPHVEQVLHNYCTVRTTGVT
jgi:hypothetical protein